jgi:hypothetical protein
MKSDELLLALVHRKRDSVFQYFELRLVQGDTAALQSVCARLATYC